MNSPSRSANRCATTPGFSGSARGHFCTGGGPVLATVGDDARAVVRKALTDNFADEADEIWAPIWRYHYGPFFDGVRSEDCESDCPSAPA